MPYNHELKLLHAYSNTSFTFDFERSSRVGNDLVNEMATIQAAAMVSHLEGDERLARRCVGALTDTVVGARGKIVHREAQ